MSTDTKTCTDVVPVTGSPPAYYGGAESITAQDLSLPRLSVAHSSSRVVQEELVPFGALFASLDADDPEPKTLWRPGGKTGVPAHILGHRGVWCYRDEENDRFVVVDVREKPAAPADDAQRGYEFAVLIPAYDLRMPCSWLVKSSAMPCGKRILTTIVRAEAEGVPRWSLAFSLTTVQRQNEKGRWYVPQAISIKPKAEHLKAAAKVAVELLGMPKVVAG